MLMNKNRLHRHEPQASAPMSVQVLIVDDDLALLHALPETVRTRMRDVLVETTDTAHDALKRIADKDYDAIITDHRPWRARSRGASLAWRCL